MKKIFWLEKSKNILIILLENLPNKMDRLDNLMTSFLFLLTTDIHSQIVLKYVEMKLYGIIGVK